RSRRVFGNVCDQLVRFFGSAVWEHASTRVSATATRAFDPVDTTLTQAYQQLWHGMAVYLERYAASANFDAKADRVRRCYRRVTGRVSTLVSTGEVESRTGTAFLQALPTMSHAPFYEAIVRSHEPISPNELTQKNLAFQAVV